MTANKIQYKKRANGHAADMELFGKVQPNDMTLEQAVLGALISDGRSISSVADIINSESFYAPKHGFIYQAIVDLYEKSEPVDIITVTERLRINGHLEEIGGSYYLIELSMMVASAANLEFHCRVLSQKAIKRGVIQVATESIKTAYDDTVDVFELLDSTEKGLFKVTSGTLGKQHSTMSSLSSRFIRTLEVSSASPGMTGVPSGFSEIDKVTSGWQSSDLIIVAARPGMGKTSLVVTAALNAAKEGHSIAIFSLEMSADQLYQRLVSQVAEVSTEKMRSGRLSDDDWRRITMASELLSPLPIVIDDTPAINIFELRAKSRRLKAKNNVSLVIVDYLQLMSGNDEGGNREQIISGISRGLKQTAKELNLPVIALSQLSRAVESRGGSKRPQLSDLRDSGAIEQDADIIAFVYRPEYYGILEDEEGRDMRGIAEIDIAKNRNGACKTVKLSFEGQYTRFGEIKEGFPEALAPPVYSVPIRTSRNDEDIPF